MNKKLLIIVGILAVIAIIVGGFYIIHNKYGSKKKVLQVTKKDLNPAQVASGFPKDTPVEPNSKVLKNFEATTNDGRVQSTRITTTAKPLDQAIKIYSDFFTKLGWKVSTTDGNSTLLRMNDDTLLISGHSSNQQNSVELTLIQAPKK